MLARCLLATCTLLLCTSCTRAEVSVGRNDPANPHAVTLPLRAGTPLTTTQAAEPLDDAGMAAHGHMHHHGGMAMGHGGGPGMKMDEAEPKSGMKLDGDAPMGAMSGETMQQAPKAFAPPEASMGWVCPMHSNIVRSNPGNCPICGMKLQPSTKKPMVKP